jgi:hypothetical protein
VYSDFYSSALMIFHIITNLEGLTKDPLINLLEYSPSPPDYCRSLESHEVLALYHPQEQHCTLQEQHCTLQEMQQENYSVINSLQKIHP